MSFHAIISYNIKYIMAANDAFENVDHHCENCYPSIIETNYPYTFSLFLNFMYFVLSSTFTCKSILKHSSINNKSDQLNGFGL